MRSELRLLWTITAIVLIAVPVALAFSVASADNATWPLVLLAPTATGAALGSAIGRAVGRYWVGFLAGWLGGTLAGFAVDRLAYGVLSPGLFVDFGFAFPFRDAFFLAAGFSLLFIPPTRIQDGNRRLQN